MMQRLTSTLPFLIGLLIGGSHLAHAQNTGPFFGQFFMNPYFFNAGYVGINKQAEAGLAIRRQWVNFKDAPTLAGFNLQFPLSRRTAFGVNIVSDRQAIVNNSTFKASFAYVVPLGRSQELRLGLSGGAGMNGLDFTAEELNTADPTVVKSVGTNFYVDGSFGAVYTLNKFRAGFALTNIFNTDAFSPQTFGSFSFSNFRNRLYSVSYRWEPARWHGIAFEPYALFRQSADRVQDFWEASALVYFKNKIWVGTGFNQNRGVALYAGVVVDELRVGYSYEAPAGQSSIQSSSHELQVTWRFGRKEQKRTSTAQKHETVTYLPKSDVVVKPPVVSPTAIDSAVAVDNTIKSDTVTRPLRYYVIAGVFDEAENARQWARRLLADGHFADLLLDPGTTKHYVYLFVSDDIMKTRKTRDEYRTKMPSLKVWVLSHE